MSEWGWDKTSSATPPSFHKAQKQSLKKKSLYMCNTLNIPLGVALRKLELQAHSHRYSIF